MKALRTLLIILLLNSGSAVQAVWFSMNAQNDPFPPYSSLDPHTFLYTRTKDRMKGLKVYVDRTERVGFSISAFGQNAQDARDIKNNLIPLGDIHGRWSMVGLLFGPVPAGETLPPLLAAARAKLFPGVPVGTPITDTNFIDKNEEIGFFSIHSCYRKRGMRLNGAGQLSQDFGIEIDGGFADICYTVTHIKNLTCDAEDKDCQGGVVYDDDFSKENINDFLMDRVEIIVPELGQRMSNFHKLSFEDLQVKLYWRHAYEINSKLAGTHYCWEKILLTPFVVAGATFATSKERNPRHLFGFTFGNDGHHSIGATTGLNLDFIQTVEIGFEVGVRHFFAHDFCNYPVPTSRSQQGIFPFSTDITVHPGLNWHFGLKLGAYRFLDCLSFYFQYLIIHHLRDNICVKTPDSAFLPFVLEKRSNWKVQVANIGFNYEVSPDITLGFLWQAPLAQRNAFRSTTVMFSFNLQY